MKLVKLWFLGTLSGLALGGGPIVCARLIGQQVDPTDYPISYLVWVGGSFITTLAFSHALPQQRWVGGAAILSGFCAAFALAIGIDIYMGLPQTLWPVGLAFVLLIGAPPTFAGTYLGAKLKAVR